MPNRILKDSICTSPEIDQLSAEAENFFYRLLVNCDDYGLFDARIPVLRSRLFPLRSMDDNYCYQLLSEVVKAGLVKLYDIDAREYLQVTKWTKHQQIRAKKPKFPQPADDNFRSLPSSDIICNHLKSFAPVIQSNPIQSESNPVVATDAKNTVSTAATAFEGHFGSVNETMRGVLKDAVFKYSDAWVKEAILETAKNNVRNWSYTEEILERWTRDGFKVDTRAKNNGHKKTSEVKTVFTSDEEIMRLANGTN